LPAGKEGVQNSPEDPRWEDGSNVVLVSVIGSLVPTLGGLAAAIAGCLWRRGHGTESAAAGSVAPRKVYTAIGAVSLAVAITVYSTRVEGVDALRALAGAILAGIAGTAVPLVVCHQVGTRVQQVRQVVAYWVVAVVPIYLFSLLVYLGGVLKLVHCAPGASDCPI
jgi:hypothetical protein